MPMSCTPGRVGHSGIATGSSSLRIRQMEQAAMDTRIGIKGLQL